MSYQQYKPTGFKLLPDVVKNLLIINVLMYIATIVFRESFGIDLVRYLGLHFVGSEYFQPFQFLTHLFMHGNTMHIFANLFALWMFGNVLENVWGGKKFLIFYLITGLGAALIHSGVVAWEVISLQNEASRVLASESPERFALFIKNNVPLEHLNREYAYAVQSVRDGWLDQPGNSSFLFRAGQLMQEYVTFKMNIPTVGASGAVFGVLLAFGMMFPNTVIYLYFAIPIKAKYFVILYGVLELFLGIRGGVTDNVAHFAHLGGMLFGYLLIKYWNRPKRWDQQEF
ncbi:MAG: rhomboid family intramembrane serine protease [Bacteroidia bacterium]